MGARKLIAAVVLGAVTAVAVPVASASAAGGGTEHFKLFFTSQTGPGSIFAQGAFTAGGTDYQRAKTDEAVFPGGGFAINHGAIHTTFTFNQKTCRGTLSGTGPYRLSSGFGDYAKIKGSGTARVKGYVETGRNANGTCNFRDESAFALSVTASGPVSF